MVKERLGKELDRDKIKKLNNLYLRMTGKEKHNISRNRYNIKPGSTWDGVDRSNGFEKNLFQKRMEAKSEKLKEYKEHVQYL